LGLHWLLLLLLLLLTEYSLPDPHGQSFELCLLLLLPFDLAPKPKPAFVTIRWRG
jgi:hypothetical protein